MKGVICNPSDLAIPIQFKAVSVGKSIWIGIGNIGCIAFGMNRRVSGDLAILNTFRLCGIDPKFLMRINEPRVYLVCRRATIEAKMG